MRLKVSGRVIRGKENKVTLTSHGFLNLTKKMWLQRRGYMKKERGKTVLIVHQSLFLRKETRQETDEKKDVVQNEIRDRRITDAVKTSKTWENESAMIMKMEDNCLREGEDLLVVVKQNVNGFQNLMVMVGLVSLYGAMAVVLVVILLVIEVVEEERGELEMVEISRKANQPEHENQDLHHL